DRRAGGRQEARARAGGRVASAARRRSQRARHRAARHDRDPPGDQGGGRNPGRDRGDVMASIAAVAPPTSSAMLPISGKPGIEAKAHASAVDFETVFLTSMFGQMFTGIDGEGPFGGGGAGGV